MNKNQTGNTNGSRRWIKYFFICIAAAKRTFDRLVMFLVVLLTLFIHFFKCCCFRWLFFFSLCVYVCSGMCISICICMSVFLSFLLTFYWKFNRFFFINRMLFTVFSVFFSSNAVAYIYFSLFSFWFVVFIYFYSSALYELLKRRASKSRATIDGSKRIIWFNARKCNEHRERKKDREPTGWKRKIIRGEMERQRKIHVKKKFKK